jgi:hypothetical protein
MFVQDPETISRDLQHWQMPHQVVSWDLTGHIPVLYKLGYKILSICEVLAIKKSLVYTTI